MTEDNNYDDGSIDYPQQYADAIEERKRLIAKLSNHVHVMTTSAINVARETHVAMCLAPANVGVQKALSDALQSALIGAEVGRQALEDLNAAR